MSIPTQNKSTPPLHLLLLFTRFCFRSIHMNRNLNLGPFPNNSQANNPPSSLLTLASIADSLSMQPQPNQTRTGFGAPPFNTMSRTLVTPDLNSPFQDSPESRRPITGSFDRTFISSRDFLHRFDHGPLTLRRPVSPPPGFPPLRQPYQNPNAGGSSSIPCVIILNPQGEAIPNPHSAFQTVHTTRPNPLYPPTASTSVPHGHRQYPNLTPPNPQPPTTPPPSQTHDAPAAPIQYKHRFKAVAVANTEEVKRKRLNGEVGDGLQEAGDENTLRIEELEEPQQSTPPTATVKGKSKMRRLAEHMTNQNDEVRVMLKEVMSKDDCWFQYEKAKDELQRAV